MSETFTCAMCGGSFICGQSDEDAMEEFESYFGKMPKSMLEVVCDDCYETIHPAKNPERVKAAKDEFEQMN